MKKFIAIICLLITNNLYSQTNVYHPFPDSAAYWNFYSQRFCVSGQSDLSYSIKIDGDTLLSGITYHKLYIPMYISNTTSFCGGMDTTLYQPGGYIGALREDTTAKKVYFSNTCCAETLLYDFNLQVGDTIQGYLTENEFPEKDVILSIDSVLVGSNYNKRWNFNNCYNLSIIEGVGFNYGLVIHSPGCIIDLDYYTLTCFNVSGSSVFPVTGSSCELITNIKNLKPENKSVDIFPNPFKNKFSIKLNDLSSIRDISVFDNGGKLIYSNMNIMSDVLNLENLNSGYYNIRINFINGNTLNKSAICLENF